MLDRRFLDVSLVVAGITNSPAANPKAGTQYIVGENPADDFSGATANQLARYDGSKWIFSNPKAGGLEVLNVETKEILSFDGTAWSVKVALAKAKNVDNFTIVDYFANKSHYYEPNNMTGYTPGEYFGVIYGGNKDTGYTGNILKANSDGKLENVNSTVVGKSFLIIKNDDDTLNGPMVAPSVNYILSAAENDYTHILYEFSKPDIVFCKQTGHFYRYDEAVDNYVDLGAGSTDDFTEIGDGVFFYYAATNSFYYVDTDNGTFTVFPISTSEGGATYEIITETHTLTAEEATAKSFTLANSIKTGKENAVFLSVCGVVQIAGVDYTASGNTINWTGKTLADIGLQAGDIFVVQYVKD